MTPAESAARHRKIAADYAAGQSSASIAAKYGCSRSTVNYAVKMYGHIRSSGKPRKPVEPKEKATPAERPVCCGRRAIPIEHPTSGVVLRHTCIRCWRTQE